MYIVHVYTHTLYIYTQAQVCTSTEHTARTKNLSVLPAGQREEPRSSPARPPINKLIHSSDGHLSPGHPRCTRARLATLSTHVRAHARAETHQQRFLSTTSLHFACRCQLILGRLPHPIFPCPPGTCLLRLATMTCVSFSICFVTLESV